MADMDSSVVSGQPPADWNLLAAAQTSAPTAPVSNTAPPPPAPDVPAESASTVGSLPAANTPANPNPSQPGQPSVWKGLALGALQGALYGAAAGAQNHGRPTAAFGAGFGGAVQAQRQKQQDQIQQQQLQMESVKAADSHIAAMNAARAADNANTEAGLDIAGHQAKTQESLEEMGITPKITIAGDNPTDIHAQATGALTTLANANGGKIPAVTTTNSPATDGNDTHTIHVYSIGQQDADKNSTLQVINANRVYNGLPPIQSQSDLQIAGAAQHQGNWRAGVAEMANDATKNLYAVPPVSKEPAANQATLNNLKQQLSTYEDHKDVNGKSDADPKLIKALQARIDAFSSTAESTRKGIAGDSAATTTDEAPAKASAAAQEEIAKNTGAAGQSAVNLAANKKTAETNAANAANGPQPWIPKVGIDEKKKAELGENIAENANTINQILARRPDLVGTISGRYTKAEQMIGTNDPDISSIGVALHNLAMANSSVHGFRSNEGVEATEGRILNGFKNGPDAVKGALKTNVDSVQTFIDNARPEGYPTHSKNGGALNFYSQKTNPPQLQLDAQQPAQRPANIPAGYVHGAGPHGPGWYDPKQFGAK